MEIGLPLVFRKEQIPKRLAKTFLSNLIVFYNLRTYESFSMNYLTSGLLLRLFCYGSRNDPLAELCFWVHVP